MKSARAKGKNKNIRETLLRRRRGKGKNKVSDNMRKEVIWQISKNFRQTKTNTKNNKNKYTETKEGSSKAKLKTTRQTNKEYGKNEDNENKIVEEILLYNYIPQVEGAREQ